MAFTTPGQAPKLSARHLGDRAVPTPGEYRTPLCSWHHLAAHYDSSDLPEFMSAPSSVRGRQWKVCGRAGKGQIGKCSLLTVGGHLSSSVNSDCSTGVVVAV